MLCMCACVATLLSTICVPMSKYTTSVFDWLQNNACCVSMHCVFHDLLVVVMAACSLCVLIHKNLFPMHRNSLILYYSGLAYNTLNTKR